jgi:hypothetical protein
MKQVCYNKQLFLNMKKIDTLCIVDDDNMFQFAGSGIP